MQDESPTAQRMEEAQRKREMQANPEFFSNCSIIPLRSPEWFLTYLADAETSGLVFSGISHAAFKSPLRNSLGLLLEPSAHHKQRAFIRAGQVKYFIVFH